MSGIGSRWRALPLWVRDGHRRPPLIGRSESPARRTRVHHAVLGCGGEEIPRS